MLFHTNSSVALTSTFLLVMVASAAGHQDRRNAIRQTWAYSLRNVKVIFLLGQGHDQQTRIQSENDFYKDIIQEDFEVRFLYLFYFFLIMKENIGHNFVQISPLKTQLKSHFLSKSWFFSGFFEKKH